MDRHHAGRPPRGRHSLLRELLARIRLPLLRSAEEGWTNWYHKPKALALLELARVRRRLNRRNLFDAYAPDERKGRELPPKPENAETVRTIDGTYNDLDDPLMGAAGLRFGRNTSWKTTRPGSEELLSPNPREVSRRLMTRDGFKPVTSLNLLAASWIQYMTHDWFSHGPPLWSDDLIEIPLAEDDPLRKKYRTTVMFVPATLPDPSRADEDRGMLAPVHVNENTHWWDASQLYGSDEETVASLRSFSGGKLLLDSKGSLPVDRLGIEKTGFRRNWWVGLSMLHELFAREHNRICGMLRESYPAWNDQRLYDTARMINAALMAKIHTLEWTPAILPNPVLESAMRANWHGLLGGRRAGTRLKHALPRSITKRYPAIFGILGGKRDLHGVPYAITEEFVSVYRMHPLLPESLCILNEEIPLQQTRNRGACKLVERFGTEALWRTFGVSHPGQLVLRNYPAFLQDLRLPGLPVFDLAAVDILRDRERGVPRYNEFRRALGLKLIRSFEDLTDDPKDMADLEDLYRGDVEALDLLVGCLAESHRPTGFGFGETAFQIFVLNASRRLQADRFYTTHYTPEVYTPEGLEHVENTTMKDLGLTQRADPASAARWLNGLRKDLLNALIGFRVLQAAGRRIDGKVPYGVRLDSFVLHPLDGEVSRCLSCAYVMSEALLGVCVRCGQDCERVNSEGISNYYRLAAIHALPDAPFDDPHPLHSGEHTAQVDSSEARDEERWFQDLFHDDQNPLDHRMDVLSVTTTMEMGIDIGSLLFVGLRNVPPTVANYQQRAGRAGRRGSSIATVFTFAQNRSHDQYYFDAPPEIVSDPPRVPALYLDNEVIARRHVRSLVLQDFFMKENRRAGAALFESWGTIAEFGSRQTAKDMRAYLATNRVPLRSRCERIVSPRLFAELGDWIDAIPVEVQGIVDARPPEENLFEVLIRSTLLPSYAFPVDVVRLSLSDGGWRSGEASYSGAMQRDLKIAVAEYAPGAEIIRQSGGVTYKYKSVGIHDPFATEPDYSPTGVLIECEHCRSVSLLNPADDLPDQCPECESFFVVDRPYLRPQGFTVDSALPSGGREVYKADGRERSGYAAPARLLVGETSFNEGRSRGPFASDLYTKVRMGDLIVTNNGPSREFPGYLICPDCGRAVDPEDTGKHKYPADVPPHRGKNRGPRAGDECPNHSDFTNQVLLAHTFASEIILLGVDLPSSLDAPFTFREPAGRAVWYSFGTLVENAAARVLQIDPDELKTGVRPVRRAPGRLHGEVFLYDDVPGGAGYARAIDENLEDILRRALELGCRCPNPDCAGACYRCLMGYRNQALHPLLDRDLGTGVLEHLLNGAMPGLDHARIDACGESLAEYARAEWKVLPSSDLGQVYFPCVLENRSTRERVGLWVIHPLAARPSKQERQRIHAQHGLRCAVHTAFDLERRPFWVLITSSTHERLRLAR